MPRLVFDGRAVETADGQTVLAALDAAGVKIDSSCRAGICQSCLVQKVEGDLPAAAQAGLTPAQQAQGLFLACVCTPTGPLSIAPAGAARHRTEASVRSLDRLSDSVLRLRLDPAGPFPYRAGQFVSLVLDGLVRSYSLAGQPERDDFLELHVRILPDGRMSQRIANDLAPGSRLTVAGPAGGCFYDGVDPDQPLVLAGTGTGLAPLWGILNDALARGHRGPIRLYHGALSAGGLYLVDEIRAVARQHPTLEYLPCVRGEDGSGDLVHTVMAREAAPNAGWYFLCGDPVLVAKLRKSLFLAGARRERIRADAFVKAA